MIESDQPTTNTRYPSLLLGLGVVWLFLAGSILVFQLFRQEEITIQWHTETEQNTAGFQLYRGLTPDGDFEPITPEMITSAGGPVSGGSYSFKDSVEPGKTYFYLIEEIENDSSTHQYEEDIISRQVPLVEWWAIVMTAVALLVGIGLVITGLREGGMA